MGAALPVIGLGMSAVGQLSAQSAAKKQAESQAKSMEYQNMIARDQLQLSKEQAVYQQQAAAVTREKQLALSQAQDEQAQQQIKEIQYKQALQYTAADLQEQQMRQQTEQAVNSMFAQAAEAESQGNYQTAQMLSQAANTIQQAGGAKGSMLARDNAMTGGTARVNRQGANDAVLNDAVRIAQNAQANRDANDRTTGYANDATAKAADLQSRMGNAAANFVNSQNSYQKQGDAIANAAGAQDLQYQSQRNQIGADAAYYSGIAASSLAQQAQQYDYMAQTSARNAQASSARSQGGNGLLSFVNVAGGLFNGLNQLGIFDSKPQAAQPFNITNTSNNFGFSGSNRISPSTNYGTGYQVPNAPTPQNTNSNMGDYNSSNIYG